MTQPNEPPSNADTPRVAVWCNRLKSDQKSGPAPNAKNVAIALQLVDGKDDAILSIPSGSRDRVRKLRDRIIGLIQRDGANSSSDGQSVTLQSTVGAAAAMGSAMHWRPPCHRDGGQRSVSVRAAHSARCTSTTRVVSHSGFRRCPSICSCRMRGFASTLLASTSSTCRRCSFIHTLLLPRVPSTLRRVARRRPLPVAIRSWVQW